MAPELQDMLAIVLMSIVSIVVPIIAYVVRQWLLARLQEAKARVPQAQLETLEMLVEIFVMAAEQSGTVGLIRREGTAKKQWVVDRVQTEMNRLGLERVPVKLIADLVEAKVLEGFNQPAAG